MNQGDPTAPRVLIVDDDSDMLSLLGLRTQGLIGFMPETAMSATEALESVQRSIEEELPFSLILMDVRMPGINGLDAAKVLRATGYSGMIAAGTAAVSELDRIKSIDSGIDAYVDKQHLKNDTLKALIESAKGFKSHER